MRQGLILFVALVLLTALRWFVLGAQELPANDAYLALCGAQPDIAYFDGPAGAPLCVYAGMRVAGVTALGAGLAWPLFAFWATIAIYLLVVRIAGQRAALTSAVVINLLPAFNQAALEPGAALPAALFALAFAACAWRALERGTPAWWLGAGLCAAAALIFSFSAWFLVPALAFVLAASHRWRGEFRRPGFWFATLPPLAVAVLLLRWDSGHGWIHFIGQTWRSALAIDLSLSGRALIDAAKSFSPFLAPFLLAGIVVALSKARSGRSTKFLVVPAIIASLQAAYVLLRGHAGIAEVLIAGVLATPLLSVLPPRLGKLPMQNLLAAACIAGAAWTSFLLAAHRPQPPIISSGVAESIERLRHEQSSATGTPVFLIAQNAPLASALALRLKDTSFVMPGHPAVYVLESPYADSQFAFWPRYDQFVDAPREAAAESPDPFTEQAGVNQFLGRTALFVGTANPGDLPQAVTAAFGAVRLLAEITTPEGEILRVYLCSDYSTLPL